MQPLKHDQRERPLPHSSRQSVCFNTGARKEIWAYGLRNPHRLNNHLLASVVGLHTWETVDVIRKGANYGYSQREGTEQLNPDKDPDLPGQAVVAGAGRVDMALPWTPPASCTSSARATA